MNYGVRFASFYGSLIISINFDCHKIVLSEQNISRGNAPVFYNLQVLGHMADCEDKLFIERDANV